jgi:hypothetical protein
MDQRITQRGELVSRVEKGGLSICAVADFSFTSVTTTNDCQCR